MPQLTPVDYDPFQDAVAAPVRRSSSAKLTPVDYDPFAAPAEQSAPASGVKLTPVDYDPFGQAAPLVPAELPSPAISTAETAAARPAPFPSSMASGAARGGRNTAPEIHEAHREAAWQAEREEEVLLPALQRFFPAAAGEPALVGADESAALERAEALGYQSLGQWVPELGLEVFDEAGMPVGYFGAGGGSGFVPLEDAAIAYDKAVAPPDLLSTFEADSEASNQPRPGWFERLGGRVREEEGLGLNAGDLLADRIPRLDPSTGEMLSLPARRDERLAMEQRRRDIRGIPAAETFGESTADFLGGLIKEAGDPLAVMTGLVGAGARGMARLAQLAAAGAAYEAASAPIEQLADAGRITNSGDIVARTVAGAAFAPAFDSAVRGIGKGIAQLLERRRAWQENLERRRNWEEALDEPPDAGPEAIDADIREGVLAVMEEAEAAGIDPELALGRLRAAVEEELPGGGSAGLSDDATDATIATNEEIVHALQSLGQTGARSAEQPAGLPGAGADGLSERLEIPLAGRPGDQPRTGEADAAAGGEPLIGGAAADVIDLPLPDRRGGIRDGDLEEGGIDAVDAGRRAASGALAIPNGVRQGGDGPEDMAGGPRTPRIEHVAVDTLASETRRASNAAEVAHVTAGLRKAGQEHVLAVVTDDAGEILRVSRLAIGGRTATLVDAGVAAGTAHSTPGAKRVWLVHNHPNESAVLSDADHAVAREMDALLRDTGIEPEGILALGARGRFTHYHPDPSRIQTAAPEPIPSGIRHERVPVHERQYRRLGARSAPLTTPEELAREFEALDLAGEGVLLLDANDRALGYVPLSQADMVKLRQGEGSPAGALLAAIDETNASGLAARIQTPDTLAMKRVVDNLGAFSRQAETRLVDVINADGVSGGGLGFAPPAQGNFYRGGGGSQVGNRAPGGPAPDERVRPDAIIRELAKQLDVPIRMGRFTRAAEGVFKNKAEVIRRHRYNDLETIAHEVGHLLEKRFPQITGLARQQRKELLPIASTPGKGGSSLSEGFAEFMRLYLSQPTEAALRAPKFHGEFEKFLGQHPDEAKVLRRAREQIDAWFRMPPEDRLASKMGEAPPSLRERWQSAGELKEAAVTAMLDAFHPIKVAVADLADGAALRPSEDPYVLARLSKGSDGIIDHFFRFGTLPFDFDARVKGSIGKPLQQILQPVSKNIDDFERYMVARRASELLGQGRENLFTREEVQGTLAKYDSSAFKQAFDDLQVFQRHVLEWARDGGMLRQEDFDAIVEANANYVPFMRVMEKGFGKKANSGFANQGDVTHRLHGSSLNIRHPLDSIVENTAALITATNRNQVARAMAELAEKVQGGGKWMERLPSSAQAVRVSTQQITQRLNDAGIKIPPAAANLLGDMQTFFRMAPQADSRSNQVIVRMGDGERVAFELDAALYQAMAAMSPPEAGLITKIMSVPARTLRAGVTLDPTFMIRNLIRDMLSAFVQSKYNYLPGIDTARGMLSRMSGIEKRPRNWALGKATDPAGDEDYRRFLAFGGDYSSMWRGEGADVALRMRDYAKRRGANETFFQSVIDSPAKLGRLLGAIGEVTEVGSRLGESRKVFEVEGKTGDAALKAAMAGREISTDFAMHGSDPSLQFLTRVTPFLNAAIQGLYKAGRTLTEDGFQKSFVPTAIRVATAITIPSLMLHLWNRGQEWYEELPEWERQQYWHVMFPQAVREAFGIGNDPFRIPKPFDYGIFGGSIPEVLLEGALKQDAKLTAEGVQAALWQSLGIRAVPLVPLIVTELATNHSFFMDRPIVPQHLQTLEPYLQHNAYSSETAKHAGDVFNVSPAKIDHAVRGFLGGLGGYVVMMTDQILRTQLDLPEKPAERWTQLPGVRAVFSRGDSGRSHSIEKFYEAMDDIRRAHASARTLEKAGDDRAQDYAADPDNQFLRSMFPLSDQVAGKLSEQRKALGKVYSSRDLTREEKAAKRDEINQAMTRSAREFLEAYNAKKAAAKKAADKDG